MLKVCCNTCKYETAGNKRFPCVKCLDTFYLNMWQEKKVPKKYNKDVGGKH